MKVLVTGAHGFLGSHVTERLLESGDSVVALVSPWGEVHNLAAALDHPGLSTIRADLTDQDAIGGVCDGVDAVVHAAARVSDWGPWEAFYRTNVLATDHLLEEAVKAGVGRFVFISSVAVHTYRGFRDADTRTLPRDNLANGYAYSKILAEDAVTLRKAIEGVILRPGLWPFGWRDATFQRVERALERGALPLMKRGESVLNTCYAENFADGVRLALRVPEAAGRTYVIADDGMPSWRELFDELARLVGTAPPRLNVPRRPARAIATGVEATWSALFPRVEPPLTRYRAALMAHDVHFSTAHASEELGYVPLVGWREGMRRSVEAL
ncbi:MAG TPA: NAD-dependent epimerase/dehydratase family protein [Trueperaceae bacterium]|nr:NAD-dependent epimerase/dehydratase family protein [Trueperaceae bacterium]